MFKAVTTSLVLAATLSFSVVGSTANAGQSCWGLEGQALQDCIAQLVKELEDASNPKNQKNAGRTTVATVGTIKQQDGGTGGTLQSVTR